MNKIALISGITGQDGSYLTELLLEKGYIVHGIVRRSSSFNRERIEKLYLDEERHQNRLHLHYGDLTDSSNLNRILERTQPTEIYNLAAQSHVHVSFQVPEYSAEVDAVGTLRLLDAIKETKIKTRFYQASTSELFGKIQEIPQTEKTPFYPRSPYAVAKLFAFWITVNYREAYNIFASNGILFNHESERRGESFVTRKISMGVARIILGLQESIVLGNIDAKRDWGYAPEYCEGMWRMLQAEKPDDFVLATNQTHTVREFIEEAFSIFGERISWKGEKANEIGVLISNGKTVIEINEKYYRPTEVDVLIGNPEKAEKLLGWKPKTTFKELVKIMTLSDYEKFKP